MTHQSISVLKANPIYSAPEILQENNYSKSSDVYAFAFIVYEIITSDIPSEKLNKNTQIYNEIVVNGNRPEIKEKVPQFYVNLIEKCWSSNPEDRPTFNDIVCYLKENQDSISDTIVAKDFMNYVSSIETLREELIVPQKVVENDICVREVKIIDTEIENDDLNKETSASATDTIEELISCNDGNKLMHFLNDNCDKETINSVFNRCLSESPDLFLSACEEGISINNPVAHHQYALYLMKNNDEVDKKTTFEKARNHLKFACKNGFDLSYFLLSRLSRILQRRQLCI